jgi:hypothetical protein
LSYRPVGAIKPQSGREGSMKAVAPPWAYLSSAANFTNLPASSTNLGARLVDMEAP